MPGQAISAVFFFFVTVSERCKKKKKKFLKGLGWFKKTKQNKTKKPGLTTLFYYAANLSV